MRSAFDFNAGWCIGSQQDRDHGLGDERDAPRRTHDKAIISAVNRSRLKRQFPRIQFSSADVSAGDFRCRFYAGEMLPHQSRFPSLCTDVDEVDSLTGDCRQGQTGPQDLPAAFAECTINLNHCLCSFEENRMEGFQDLPSVKTGCGI